MPDSTERSSETTTYECLTCGMIVERETHPVRCDECGGDFHDRSKPRE
ncbi:MAG: rubrerythrin-like domain-containing protein [Salinirussus sp.]